jgi:hypothetical protein
MAAGMQRSDKLREAAAAYISKKIYRTILQLDDEA